MVNCIKTIVHTEGTGALYKGLTPFVTHLTLKYALRFGSFAWFREALGAQGGASTPGRDFAAGLAAGLTEAVLIVTPFEVIKTRLQQQVGTTNLAYKGPVHCAMRMAREEGAASLWKGCAPTMIRQGSNQAFNFMSFSLLGKVMWGKREGDGRSLAPWKNFVTGVLAGAVGPCFNSPVDVIKTRMMAQRTVPGEAEKYATVSGTVRTIAREEGAAALWKGLVPRLMRLAPGQGITWAVVMKVTSLFEDRS